MRTFKVVKKTDYLLHEYISVGVQYTLNQLADNVYYCRDSPEISCSYMRLSTFKRALRDSLIVFTD